VSMWPESKPTATIDPSHLNTVQLLALEI
jgi:hypothetical protein